MSPEILCLGELLIDFVSVDADKSLADSSGFAKAPGGAPANVAAGLSRLGRKSGFIGKVGRDPFGEYLKQVLEDVGIDVSGMSFDEEARTTLSFVANRSDGVRDCMFYRNPGADMRLTPEDLDESMFANAKVFHFGSISLGCEPVRTATMQALEWAKRHGLLVSYDPNLRLSLWNDEELAKQEIRAAFRYADVVKISEEEMEFVTGAHTLEESASYILNQGPKLVVITKGGDGCFYTDGHTSGSFEGHQMNVVETTGAGDAFVAGLLTRLLERRDRLGRFELAVDEETIAAIKFANAAGALATTRVGAIPAMPTPDEVQTLLGEEIVR
ncbi:PfkB family carbohydrate kinase [Cohnella abietis]|uniref:Fructokinase n=1 Tax=Cohnella abietis TaxID=2507935 RepID=A0A3T1D472_9BACL|nr:PfkB family carbohydrate kinase [Cohnella abietis]BBI32838.1 fructokinase [Cohnella abietis]